MPGRFVRIHEGLSFTTVKIIEYTLTTLDRGIGMFSASFRTEANLKQTTMIATSSLQIVWPGFRQPNKKNLTGIAPVRLSFTKLQFILLANGVYVDVIIASPVCA